MSRPRRKENAQRLFQIQRLFFTHRSFDRSFYRTVVYCLLIYAWLTLCADNLLLLPLLIARLSTETAAFVSFRLLRRQHVCFWMYSDVRFCFSSQSFSPSSASPLSPVAAYHSLTSASPAVASPLSHSPSCRSCRLYTTHARK